MARPLCFVLVRHPQHIIIRGNNLPNLYRSINQVSTAGHFSVPSVPAPALAKDAESPP